MSTWLQSGAIASRTARDPRSAKVAEGGGSASSSVTIVSRDPDLSRSMISGGTRIVALSRSCSTATGNLAWPIASVALSLSGATCGGRSIRRRSDQRCSAQTSEPPVIACAGDGSGRIATEPLPACSHCSEVCALASGADRATAAIRRPASLPCGLAAVTRDAKRRPSTFDCQNHRESSRMCRSGKRCGRAAPCPVRHFC